MSKNGRTRIGTFTTENSVHLEATLLVVSSLVVQLKHFFNFHFALDSIWTTNHLDRLIQRVTMNKSKGFWSNRKAAWNRENSLSDNLTGFGFAIWPPAAKNRKIVSLSSVDNNGYLQGKMRNQKGYLTEKALEPETSVHLITSIDWLVREQRVLRLVAVQLD